MEQCTKWAGSAPDMIDSDSRVDWDTCLCLWSVCTLIVFLPQWGSGYSLRSDWKMSMAWDGLMMTKHNHVEPNSKLCHTHCPVALGSSLCRQLFGSPCRDSDSSQLSASHHTLRWHIFGIFFLHRGKLPMGSVITSWSHCDSLKYLTSDPIDQHIDVNPSIWAQAGILMSPVNSLNTHVEHKHNVKRKNTEITLMAPYKIKLMTSF